MRALLDTHAFLWAAIEPEKLSATAQEVCESAELVVSVATVWEIAIKVQIGRLVVPGSVRTFIADQLRRGALDLLPISAAHALRASELPLTHRDPFDRMLAAQSLEERIPLITRDPAFGAYQVDTIW